MKEQAKNIISIVNLLRLRTGLIKHLKVQNGLLIEVYQLGIIWGVI